MRRLNRRPDSARPDQNQGGPMEINDTALAGLSRREVGVCQSTMRVVQARSAVPDARGRHKRQRHGQSLRQSGAGLRVFGAVVRVALAGHVHPSDHTRFDASPAGDGLLTGHPMSIEMARTEPGRSLVRAYGLATVFARRQVRPHITPQGPDRRLAPEGVRQ